MEWGSSYIYDYQNSSEEELSCNELEEGMWLSDSEGEDSPPPIPVPLKPPKSSRPGFLSRMFGRRGQQTQSDPTTNTRFVVVVLLTKPFNDLSFSQCLETLYQTTVMTMIVQIQSKKMNYPSKC